MDSFGKRGVRLVYDDEHARMMLAGAWFGTGFLPVLPRRLINQRVIALEFYV
jgi:hypothetical protein